MPWERAQSPIPAHLSLRFLCQRRKPVARGTPGAEEGSQGKDRPACWEQRAWAPLAEAGASQRALALRVRQPSEGRPGGGAPRGHIPRTGSLCSRSSRQAGHHLLPKGTEAPADWGSRAGTLSKSSSHSDGLCHFSEGQIIRASWDCWEGPSTVRGRCLRGRTAGVGSGQPLSLGHTGRRSGPS